MLKPLFIFSLPRSGSTLLQRVLAADSQIASVAEPWMLLPFVYALRERGISAEYSHQSANLALNDFIRELPNGKKDYLSAIGSAMNELYRKATKDGHARYFLDKTPRYALIADEIFEMFPEGKFIMLWRNPLAVIASIIDTWGDGKWNLSKHKVDLFDGLAKLIHSYQSHSDKVLAVQYESFLRSPEEELSRIAEYLELKLEPDLLKSFHQVKFRGKMGDPTGVKNYREVESGPLEKWKAVINNPLRKMWCRRYLRWLGEERLRIMGYELNELLHELDSAGMSVRNLISDSIAMAILNDRTLKCFELLRNAFVK